MQRSPSRGGVSALVPVHPAGISGSPNTPSGWSGYPDRPGRAWRRCLRSMLLRQIAFPAIRGGPAWKLAISHESGHRSERCRSFCRCRDQRSVSGRRPTKPPAGKGPPLGFRPARCSVNTGGNGIGFPHEHNPSGERSPFSVGSLWRRAAWSASQGASALSAALFYPFAFPPVIVQVSAGPTL